VRCGGVRTGVIPVLGIGIPYVNAHRGSDFDAGGDPGRRGHRNSSSHTLPHEQTVAFSVGAAVSHCQICSDLDVYISADLDRYACADGDIGPGSHSDSQADRTPAGNCASADGTVAGRHI
jgi:hypothetical protein